jgi:hypothetical protein
VGASFVGAAGAGAASVMMIVIDAAALIFDSCAAGQSRNAFDREAARNPVAREQHEASHEP